MLQVEDRVNRIEDREITGGVVLEIIDSKNSDDSRTILISYDEGGRGYWPEESLEKILD